MNEITTPENTQKTIITQTETGFSFYASIPICLPQNSEKIMAGDYSTISLSGHTETLADAKSSLKEALKALKEARKDAGE